MQNGVNNLNALFTLSNLDFNLNLVKYRTAINDNTDLIFGSLRTAAPSPLIWLKMVQHILRTSQYKSLVNNCQFDFI